MPLQNRVTPLGELVAVPDRGLVYGNRGCLHDAAGRIVRLYGTRRWIACRLEFKGWHRSPLMQPGRLTELFFLDEATAFAAGHRPCAECRREDYRRFLALTGASGADEIDARLHAERLDGRRALPRAAVRRAARRRVRPARRRARSSSSGASSSAGRPAATRSASRGRGVERRRVITPPSTLAVLRGGWDGAVPFLHPTSQMFVAAARPRGVASPTLDCGFGVRVDAPSLPVRAWGARLCGAAAAGRAPRSPAGALGA